VKNFFFIICSLLFSIGFSQISQTKITTDNSTVVTSGNNFNATGTRDPSLTLDQGYETLVEKGWLYIFN
jgi:hypothetical protein